MNSYVEKIHHCTLNDGDYYPLLQFCIDAAINLMISFPDAGRDPEAGLIPFEEDESPEEEGAPPVKKKLFGNRSTGVEVILQTGETDTVIAATYGLPDRESISIKSFRDRGESCYNRTMELHITVRQMKAAALIELFRSVFRNVEPDDNIIDEIKKDALLKLSLEKWSSAADDAGYLLQYMPDDPELLYILGKSRGEEGNWRIAKKSLLKSVELLPENTDAWYHLGKACMKGSSNSGALHCFDKVLESDPENHCAFYMKGVIFEETEREDEAVEAYRYAVKFSPGSGDGGDICGEVFTGEAKNALERLGHPWRGDEDLPDPEGADINEDIIRAASEGDTGRIGSLLKKGGVTDFRSRDKIMHGRTPLISAALNSHYSTVKYLLEHGAGADYEDENGCTPLASVIEWGESVEIIKLLIKNGADVNGKDPFGRPLLLNEITLGNREILTALAEAGALLDVTDRSGSDGIICASSEGRTEAVEFFLHHGADVNIRNHSGITPLIIASANGSLEIVRLLLQNGADPQAADREGRTPLILASGNADHDTIALLIKNGADVNHRDLMGRSAIDVLMESGKRDDMERFRKCVELLTDAGAELMHQNDNKQ